MECLECKKIFNNYRSLSAHLRLTHKIKLSTYIEKYKLGRRCKECNSLLSKYNKFDYCNHHYDRHKIGLGMFGKQHTVASKKKMSILHQQLWKDAKFRNSHKQSQKTKDKRATSIKNAHIKDITLSIRQTLKIRQRSKKIKNLTYTQIYGEEKAKELINKQKQRLLGTKQSEETKRKRGIYKKGRVVSLSTRLKISNTRKKRIASGEIKISYKAGRGESGFRKDIGHYIRSSYEYKFAKFLKHYNIEYNYEPRRFAVIVDNKKRIYIPDFNVKNVWFEIKNSYNEKNSLFNKKLKSFVKRYPTEKIYVIVGNSKNVESWKVMNEQQDLVKVLVELKPLAVIKG